jgi:c-di-GMP-binding flagellar brake protein YcgR
MRTEGGMQIKNSEDERASKEQAVVAKRPVLPLEIGGDLTIRSLVNIAHKIDTKIIGAVQGEYILIKEPILPINERLSAVFESYFTCSYFNSGYVYKFQSKQRQRFGGDLISIDYPHVAEIIQIRKHRRIKVNIETELTSTELRLPLTGDMVDISAGGCCLLFSSSTRLIKGKDVYLEFDLPDDQKVKGLKSRVMSIKRGKSPDTVEVGLSFLDPPSECDKVSDFCEFCMFFDLE